MTESIYNRDYGLKNFMDPQGNVYGVAAVPGGQSLYRIGKVNKDGIVEELKTAPTESFRGSFTHKERAKRAILDFLVERWNDSDEQIAANLQKRGASAKRDSVAA